MPAHGLEQGGPAWRRHVEEQRMAWVARRHAAGRGRGGGGSGAASSGGSDPGMPATGGQAWLLKKGEVGR
jgi:hypothetical protein